MLRRSFAGALRSFWIEDASFVVLLLMLTLTIFVMPVLLELDIVHPQTLHLTLMLIYLAGIWSARHKGMLILAIAVFTVSLVLNIADLLSDDQVYKSVLWVTYSINTAIFIVTNLDLLFRDDRFNFHRVLGAVNVYLLFAMLGAFSLEMIQSWLGTSLKGEVDLSGADQDFGDYIYFSLVSLTTVGFGEIQPANSAAKMLSVFLSTLGILFPAVVIARLLTKPPEELLKQ